MNRGYFGFAMMVHLPERGVRSDAGEAALGSVGS